MKKHALTAQMAVVNVNIIVVKTKLFALDAVTDMSLTLKITSVKYAKALMKQWMVVKVVYIIFQTNNINAKHV